MESLVPTPLGPEFTLQPRERRDIRIDAPEFGEELCAGQLFANLPSSIGTPPNSRCRVLWKSSTATGSRISSGQYMSFPKSTGANTNRGTLRRRFLFLKVL
jgi:hypothetical protein